MKSTHLVVAINLIECLKMAIKISPLHFLCKKHVNALVGLISSVLFDLTEYWVLLIMNYLLIFFLFDTKDCGDLYLNSWFFRVKIMQIPMNYLLFSTSVHERSQLYRWFFSTSVFSQRKRREYTRSQVFIFRNVGFVLWSRHL